MTPIHLTRLLPLYHQHLIERSWYAVTETCLAFTVFRDDFSPRFVALFTLLLFLKCFHWLAEDRVDFVSDNTESAFSFNRAYSTPLPCIHMQCMCVCDLGCVPEL